MKRIAPTIIVATFLSVFQGYGATPSGREWENPEALGYGKEQTTPFLIPFHQEKCARTKFDLSAHGLTKSLDGKWAFNWVPRPSARPVEFFKPDYNATKWDSIMVPGNWNVQGIGADGSLRYGKPIYVNQKVIFQHSVKPDDWRGGVMRTPPKNWTTYTDRNEVGSYRRSFSIPADWKDMKVFLRFGGVDSFFYLWVNGKYVGYSKNSRTASVFNITPYLNPEGENTVAVEVYRNSDGSMLEAQDMFRLPGIFRSVSLYAVPQSYIADLQVRPELLNNYSTGKLSISSDVKTTERQKGLKIQYKLYAQTQLYKDEFTTVPVAETTVDAGKGAVMTVEHPELWSAELPYRYLLTATLLDKKGKTIESTRVITGFRSVEIKDVPATASEYGQAGRYLLVNGKPVKFRGVNRHETDPSKGHSVSEQHMEAEIMAMKRANINHVRNSHYPDDEYWYYLADKYGIYLMDEANVESHEYYYGKASLSHVPEWRAAHVGRVMDMARSNANHPSIVMWSLGNEAGPGVNFKAAYDSLKAFDATRPINYERNNDYADLGSCQYPSVEWVEEAATGKLDIKYPFHINEYAHSMGNSMGNLIDYWRAIESSDYIMGAAIWDWVDQGLYYTKEGKKIIAYGGDFGDFPNDGQFVMNGLMLADLTPKPQYYEVQKVYQPIEVKALDSTTKQLEIFNKNYFVPLTGYVCKATLLADGKEVASADIALNGDMSPRSRTVVDNPLSGVSLEPGKEYFLNISFLLDKDMPWAEKGYRQMAEQIAINNPVPYVVEKVEAPKKGKIKTSKTSVTGKDFAITFDPATGLINTLSYDGKEIITPGHGPRPDLFRALVNNDNWMYKSTYAAGLHNMRYSATDWKQSKKNGNAVFTCTLTAQAPNKAILRDAYSNNVKIEEMPDSATTFRLTGQVTYTVSPEGVVNIHASFNSTDTTLIVPRLGFAIELPSSFREMEYYGRGPVENYADRKSGAFMGYYKSATDKEFVNYAKPQNMGNHEDTRMLMLTDSQGKGLRFTASQPFAFTALDYSENALATAAHPQDLTPDGYVYLHIDKKVTGLGGNSCGQGAPLPRDRATASPWHFSFTITPVNF